MEKELSARFRDQLEVEKGMGLFLQVCCDKFQIKGIFDIAP